MLAEDIKNGSFKSSYLLYGEEAYLRTQYKNRLKNALADPSDTMNFSRFEEKASIRLKSSVWLRPCPFSQSGG